jgi:hypothetical protein
MGDSTYEIWMKDSTLISWLASETLPTPPSTYPSRHATSSSGFYDTLSTQLSELLSSVVTLADSGNIEYVAYSSPSRVIDFRANKHISSSLICILLNTILL